VDAPPAIPPIRGGPLRSLLLLQGAPVAWDRLCGPGYGVDITAPGSPEAVLTVFGTTEEEAAQRAREVLAALARVRTRS